MTAQPQENSYEVMMWVEEWDEQAGEHYSRLLSRGTCASLEEANASAQREHECSKAMGRPKGVAVLEDGVVVACYGHMMFPDLPFGRVVGWRISTWTEDWTGQYDGEDYEEHDASTPGEWEQIERQTRRQNRRLYVKVQSMGKVECFGGRPGKRHKWTPDFFSLGMKLVQKTCDFCQESFWFPHGKSAGRQGYMACEKHCQLL